MLIAVLVSAALSITAPAAAPATTAQHVAVSAKAQDMTGVEPSLYRGKWYSKQYESTRRCIITRESHGNYRAANTSSSARGAYQFLDRQWRTGLIWMMLAESKHTHDGLAPQIKALRAKPIHTWNRYWQDRAFWTAWRHGDGAHHWAYAPKPCT